jgi:sodium/bile acid cotransporter 7
MRRFLKRFWFLIALGLIMALAANFPRGGEAVRRAEGVLPLLVSTTLFISGFTLRTAHFLEQATRWRPLLLGLSATYLAAPLLGYGLARLFGPSPLSDPTGAHFLQAVMLAAAQAGTLASAIALTVVARGDQELALFLTLVSNALTALLTPLILELSVGAVVELPVAEMMGRLALVVLLPVALGQLARRLLWKTAVPILPGLRLVPQLIILVFVYTAFSSASRHLAERPQLALQFLGACACLHTLLLLFTYGASNVLGLAPEARAAVVYCGSQKTLPNGMYLWDRFFPANPYGAVALALYHAFQLIADTLILPWLEVPGARAAEPEAPLPTGQGLPPDARNG